MMSSLTDQQVIDLIITGDTKLYALLIDRYKHMVYTAAYRVVKVKEDAEEVAQDTFLNAFKALHSFKGDCKLSTWLYRIAYNKSLDYLKRNARQIKSVSLDIPESIDIGTVDRSMDLLENEDRKKLVQKAIQTLPNDDGLLITWFYLEELSLVEIAEIIECSPNTIKVRLHRSRKRLLSILKEKLKPEIIYRNGG